MAAPKRTAEERDEQLVRIAELYCLGLTQLEIGARLGISRQQVSYDLKEIHEGWRNARLESIDKMKHEQLAKVDALEQQAWKAFWRSVGSKVRTTEKLGKPRVSGDGQEDDGYELQEVKWEDAGDPRFLDQVHKCIEQRCKILGLHAPVKHEDTGADMPPRDKMIETVRERLASRGITLSQN